MTVPLCAWCRRGPAGAQQENPTSQTQTRTHTLRGCWAQSQQPRACDLRQPSACQAIGAKAWPNRLDKHQQSQSASEVARGRQSPAPDPRLDPSEHQAAPGWLRPTCTSRPGSSAWPGSGTTDSLARRSPRCEGLSGRGCLHTWGRHTSAPLCKLGMSRVSLQDVVSRFRSRSAQFSCYVDCSSRIAVHMGALLQRCAAAAHCAAASCKTMRAHLHACPTGAAYAQRTPTGCPLLRGHLCCRARGWC